MQVVLLSLLTPDDGNGRVLSTCFDKKRGVWESSQPHGDFWVKRNRLESLEILNVKWNYKGDDSRARVHCYIRDGEHTALGLKQTAFKNEVTGLPYMPKRSKEPQPELEGAAVGRGRESTAERLC